MAACAGSRAAGQAGMMPRVPPGPLRPRPLAAAADVDQLTAACHALPRAGGGWRRGGTCCACCAAPTRLTQSTVRACRGWACAGAAPAGSPNHRGLHINTSRSCSMYSPCLPARPCSRHLRRGPASSQGLRLAGERAACPPACCPPALRVQPCVHRIGCRPCQPPAPPRLSLPSSLFCPAELAEPGQPAPHRPYLLERAASLPLARPPAPRRPAELEEPGQPAEPADDHHGLLAGRLPAAHRHQLCAPPDPPHLAGWPAAGRPARLAAARRAPQLHAWTARPRRPPASSPARPPRRSCSHLLTRTRRPAGIMCHASRARHLSPAHLSSFALPTPAPPPPPPPRSHHVLRARHV